MMGQKLLMPVSLEEIPLGSHPCQVNGQLYPGAAGKGGAFSVSWSLSKKKGIKDYFSQIMC